MTDRKPPRTQESGAPELLPVRRPTGAGSSQTSFHPVTREFLRDVGLKRFGGGDVGFAPRAIAFLTPGDAAPLERACQFRLKPQCRVKIRNRVIELTELQMDETTAVQGVCVI